MPPVAETVVLAGATGDIGRAVEAAEGVIVGVDWCGFVIHAVEGVVVLGWRAPREK